MVVKELRGHAMASRAACGDCENDRTLLRCCGADSRDDLAEPLPQTAPSS
jgi:hypothetical protein